MEDFAVYSITIITIFVVSVIISQLCTGKVVKCIKRTIKKSSEDLLINLETSNEFKNAEKAKDLIRLGIYNMKADDKLKERLNFLTQIIGLIEFIIFGFLTIYLFNNEQIIFEKIKFFLIVFAGWFGLKAFGNYQQWGHEIFGRALFYNFLIGTLINIFFAVMFGLVIYLIKQTIGG